MRAISLFVFSALAWCQYIPPGGGGGGSGTVTNVATGSGLTGGPISTTGTIACATGSASVFGCLPTADWTVFNSKQAALGFTPLNPANNLSEVTAATARTNLGLGTSATHPATDFQTALGFTPEDVANKSTSTSLGTSNTLYPTQNAVKVYADAHAGATIPSTTDLISGNGSGNGADSGIAMSSTTTGRLYADPSDYAWGVNGTGSSTGFVLRNRANEAGVTFAVPMFKPNTTGKIAVFDIMPKGTTADLAASDTAGNARVASDWCLDDLALDTAGYRCLQTAFYYGAGSPFADIGFAQAGSHIAEGIDLNIKSTKRLYLKAGNDGAGNSSTLAYLSTNASGGQADVITFYAPSESGRAMMSVQDYSFGPNRAMMLANNFPIAWSSTTSADNLFGLDTGIHRASAGVLEVNNGTPGTLRDLTFRTVTGGTWNGSVIGSTYGGLGAALNAAAAHSTIISNGATPAVYSAKTIPDCTDTGGNHLNFTQSTDAFSCGTSSGASGVTSLAATSPFAVSGSTGAVTGSLLVNVDYGFTAQQTVTRAGIGATSTDGLLLTNTTAAANNAQQWSPAVHWHGLEWDTASGGSSKPWDWRMEIVPIQGSSATTGALSKLRVSTQFNNGTVVDLVSFYGTSNGQGFEGMYPGSDFFIGNDSNKIYLGGPSATTFVSGFGNLTVKSTQSSQVPATIFGIASQTGDLLDFKDSGSNIKALIGPLTIPASVSSATGTVEPTEFSFTPPGGGNTSIATTGTGGAAGAWTVTMGVGGTANSAVTADTGGAGGAITFAGGAGAAATASGSGTNIGGAGGNITWTPGAGGAASGGSVNTAGRAGEVVLAGDVRAGGISPSVSGCSFSAQSGGSLAGTYTSGTTGTCTVTITFPSTAPTGWTCHANDRVTVADLQSQTASTTTTATISGTTISGDVIGYICVAY